MAVQQYGFRFTPPAQVTKALTPATEASAARPVTIVGTGFLYDRITDFNIRFNQSGMSEVSTPYRPGLRFICNSPTHTLAGGDVKMVLDGVLVVNSVRPTIEPNSGAAMQVGYYSNGQLTNEVRFGDLRHAVRP